MLSNTIVVMDSHSIHPLPDQIPPLSPPMTPIFYCSILFYSKNGDLQKKKVKCKVQYIMIWLRYRVSNKKKHFQSFQKKNGFDKSMQ